MAVCARKGRFFYARTFMRMKVGASFPVDLSGEEMAPSDFRYVLHSKKEAAEPKLRCKNYFSNFATSGKGATVRFKMPLR